MSINNKNNSWQTTRKFTFIWWSVINEMSGLLSQRLMTHLTISYWPKTIKFADVFINETCNRKQSVTKREKQYKTIFSELTCKNKRNVNWMNFVFCNKMFSPRVRARITLSNIYLINHFLWWFMCERCIKHSSSR